MKHIEMRFFPIGAFVAGTVGLLKRLFYKEFYAL
jgi:hypothetical protein